MARAPTTWQGMKCAFWALVHNNLASPLARLGDWIFEFSLRLFNFLSEIDDKTKDFKKYCEDKAWPED